MRGSRTIFLNDREIDLDDDGGIFDKDPLTQAEIDEANGIDPSDLIYCEHSEKELDDLSDYATELAEEASERRMDYLDYDDERDCRD